MSLDSFYLLIVGIMLVLIMRTVAQGSSTSSPPTLGPCGQYGFRCVDSKSYQVCLISSEEDESPEEVHECREGMICDEDNPAFCTPIDPLLTTQKPARLARESDYAMYDELYERKNGRGRNNEIESCGCTEEFPTVMTTTTQAPVFTTTIISAAPEFDCEGYGFYPDFANHTLFWYCDVPNSGDGFLVRHMICGQGRVFDSVHRACVIPGTTKTLLMQEERKRKKQADPISEDRTRRFSCCGRRPGRYADKDNCRLYHYCLTKEFAPVEELTLLCPKGTAYDPSANKCSCYATYRCMDRKRSQSNQYSLDDDALRDYPEELQEVEESDERKQTNGNINCQTPMRFRDVNSCDGYFLCFGDQVIEMDCPEYYKFDDNLLECLPEKIARCH